MKHLTLQIRAHWAEHRKLACIIIFLTPVAAAAWDKGNFKNQVRNMLILKRQRCRCNLHLYLSSAFHHILHLSLFQMHLACLSFSPEALLLLAPLLWLQVENAAHTQVCVCVSASDSTLGFRPYSTIHIYAVFCSNPAVLSKLHRQGTEMEGTYYSHTPKTASFAFSLIQIRFTHKII